MFPWSAVDVMVLYVKGDGSFLRTRCYDESTGLS